MIIRCACGNETTVVSEKDFSWLSREWYNEERDALECPKCKEKTEPLPLELIDASGDGDVKVKLDIYRSVALTRKRF